MNEINREKRLLIQIARVLAGMFHEDMTTCEKQIAKLLVDELYLTKEVQSWDNGDGPNSDNLYRTVN